MAKNSQKTTSKKTTAKKRTKKEPFSKRASDTIKADTRYEPKWGNQFNKVYTNNEIEKLADEMVNYFKEEKTAIHITSFCVHKLIHRQRLYDFEKSNEYFQRCMEMVRILLVDRSIKLGFEGKNSTFAIFYLTNIAKDEFKHKQVIEHEGSIEERIRNMTPEQRSSRIKQLEKKIANDRDKRNN